MLRRLSEMYGFKLHAADGRIGDVHDLFFDDARWIVRYVVVDTGTLLPGRRVLVPPHVCGAPDWSDRTLPVSLTIEQVQNSPPITADKPVSRQQELTLHEYFGWNPYWNIEPITGAQSPALAAQQQTLAAEAGVASGSPARQQPHGDPNLRSCREVAGYHVQAIDGDIGHVKDFVADDQTWTIHYMVVETRNWLPGRKVILAPAWVEQIAWPQQKVRVGLTRQQIRASPELDETQPLDRAYESRLYEHYSKPPYW